MERPTTKGLARRSSPPCEYGKLRTLQAAAIQSLQVLFKGASDFAGYTDFVGCELWSGGSSPGLTRCPQKLSRIPRLFCLRYAELGSGVLALLIYRRWGFSSMLSWRIAWGMQGAVICARALAVAEVCRGVLGRYRGIRAPIRKIDGP
jgi:hypothetical protein